MKAILKTFRNLALIAIGLLILGLFMISVSSCSTKKSFRESIITTQKDSLVQLTESIRNTEREMSDIITRNKAISDQHLQNVPKSNTGNRRVDSLVDAKIDIILSMLNTNKQSGDNGYLLFYDAQLRQLRAEITVAATENRELITSLKNEIKEQDEKILSQEKELKAERDKETTRESWPWWLWAGIIYFGLKIITRIAGAVNYPIPVLKDLL